MLSRRKFFLSFTLHETEVLPKNSGSEAPYFANWKVLWKRGSLRIIRRFLKEEWQELQLELQSNQVKIPFMN